MSPVPAACVHKGHQVAIDDDGPILEVTAIHLSTPVPGQITWDLKEGQPVQIGAAEMVLILNPDPIKEPSNGRRRR